jgi:hypothetical protein
MAGREVAMRGLRWAGVLCVVAVAIAAVPSFAGVTYKSVTKVESGAGKLPMSQEISFQAWISGGNAKTEMSGSGPFPAGSYMLKRADNAAMLMVNPGNKTYAVWDPEQMMGGIAKAVQSAFRIEDAKWEKVSEEEGGQVSGFPTEHYHYRFSYTMVVTIQGKDERAPATMEQEYWTTEKLADPGLAAASGYGLVQQLSGLSPEIEQMLRAETQEMKGFPLKQEWTIRTTTDGDQAFEQKMTTTVTDIQVVDVPEKVFVVPADYKQTVPPPFEPMKELKTTTPEI